MLDWEIKLNPDLTYLFFSRVHVVTECLDGFLRLSTGLWLFQVEWPWAFISAFSWHLILSGLFDSQHRLIRNSIRFSFSTEIIFSSQVKVFWYTGVWMRSYFFTALVIFMIGLSSIAISTDTYSHKPWLASKVVSAVYLFPDLPSCLSEKKTVKHILLPRLFSKASVSKKILLRMSLFYRQISS